MVLDVFSGSLLAKLLFCVFAGGSRPRVLSNFPLETQKNQFEVGTWIPSGFGGFFGSRLTKLLFCGFAGGGAPRVLETFPLKT